MKKFFILLLCAGVIITTMQSCIMEVPMGYGPGYGGGWAQTYYQYHPSTYRDSYGRYHQIYENPNDSYHWQPTGTDGYAPYVAPARGRCYRR